MLTANTTTFAIIDMMENDNPVLEELKLRMGYSVARKTEAPYRAL